ncbi:Ribosome-binding protein 1, partial [Ophiophagus hannah]
METARSDPHHLGHAPAQPGWALALGMHIGGGKHVAAGVPSEREVLTCIAGGCTTDAGLYYMLIYNFVVTTRCWKMVSLQDKTVLIKLFTRTAPASYLHLRKPWHQQHCHPLSGGRKEMGRRRKEGGRGRKEGVGKEKEGGMEGGREERRKEMGIRRRKAGEGRGKGERKEGDGNEKKGGRKGGREEGKEEEREMGMRRREEGGRRKGDGNEKEGRREKEQEGGRKEGDRYEEEGREEMRMRRKEAGEGKEGRMKKEGKKETGLRTWPPATLLPFCHPLASSSWPFLMVSHPITEDALLTKLDLLAWRENGPLTHALCPLAPTMSSLAKESKHSSSSLKEEVSAAGCPLREAGLGWAMGSWCPRSSRAGLGVCPPLPMGRLSGRVSSGGWGFGPRPGLASFTGDLQIPTPRCGSPKEESNFCLNRSLERRRRYRWSCVREDCPSKPAFLPHMIENGDSLSRRASLPRAGPGDTAPLSPALVLQRSTKGVKLKARRPVLACDVVESSMQGRPGLPNEKRKDRDSLALAWSTQCEKERLGQGGFIPLWEQEGGGRDSEGFVTKITFFPLRTKDVPTRCEEAGHEFGFPQMCCSLLAACRAGSRIGQWGGVLEYGEGSDKGSAFNTEMGPGPSESYVLTPEPPESDISKAEEQGEPVPNVRA